MKNNPGNSTEESETSRSRTLLRSDVPNIAHVEEKLEFKVDLRIEGIAHEVILKDEERLGQIQVVVEKMRTGSYTKCIREDRRKPENSLIFSEETRRIIHELGNLELYELGQMSSTIQCHSCYKHLPEGPKIWISRICLRPDEDTIRKIEARFKTVIVPHVFAYINRSRGKKCVPMAKRSLESEGRRHEQRSKMARILSQSGGNRMSSTENRRWPTDGLRSTANIWITSRRLIWTTRPRGDKDTDTKVLWTVKDRQCEAMSRRSDYKPTTNALIGLRQEQGRQNSYIPKMRDQGKNHSTKNCKRNWNG